MPSLLTDKLRKASGSTRPVTTSLALAKANGATTAELTSGTGWNTSTAVDVVIYRRVLNTTTGLYEKVSGTQTEWVAILTGTTLTLPALPNAGTEPAAGYAADGNSIVYCAPTAQWSDDVIDTLLTLFNQDQTLKAAPIQTALGLGAGALNGWNALGFAPSSVTANGNRSYDLVFTSQDLTSTLSAGMRLRTTRTVAAPTQCTSLNGTSQYYSKSSPAGMTFTDDFVVGAWVKLISYGTNGVIESRYDGTNGWQLYVDTSGRITIAGYAGSGNVSQGTTYQSIPLNKWVHVTAQLDMSAFTGTTTTTYVMIDGVDIPLTVSRGGTNPTALVQAGTLQVGAGNSTSFFPGKIAQAFVSSAKITQANVRLLKDQGLTSALISTHSIISAYSFSNAITDLNTTNANNLTANGSAVATNADSPFGGQASGSISSTLDYAIVQSATFSTNTTLTVQVPEGCTIPTSGGVASVVYSSNAVPYGFPKAKAKWQLSCYTFVQDARIGVVAATTLNHNNRSLSVPIGEWALSQQYAVYSGNTSATAKIHFSTSSSSVVNPYGMSSVNASTKWGSGSASAVQSYPNIIGIPFTALTQQVIYTVLYNDSGGTRDFVATDNESGAWIVADNTLL